MKPNFMPHGRLGECRKPRWLRPITVRWPGDTAGHIVGGEYDATHDWQPWPGDARYEACSRCGEQRRVNQSAD